METALIGIAALFTGFLLDQILGDPEKWPHPIVAFGKAISFFEKRFNNGRSRFLKGTFTTLLLTGSVLALSFFGLKLILDYSSTIWYVTTSIIVFFCLAGCTLRKEVRGVFEALNESTEKGRNQLSRIVGRDTQHLSPQQIRTAALETLAENLSDGVIAPLFWFVFFGAPGILTYKMINTLDSMIGYKNDRYLLFGRFAAKLDDAANYIPARITALIMLMVVGKTDKIKATFINGKNHASPNSGYPEAALANILNCRFGGPNYYFGQLVEKPYIGTQEKLLTNEDLQTALKVNKYSELVMAFITATLYFIIHYSINIFQ